MKPRLEDSAGDSNQHGARCSLLIIGLRIDRKEYEPIVKCVNRPVVRDTRFDTGCALIETSRKNNGTFDLRVLPTQYFH